jgi:hypothetical protein
MNKERIILPELLYHGSTVVIKKINLLLGAPHKDFGKGFYTTSSEQQAEKFAIIKARREKLLSGYLNIYEYNPDNTLKFKHFEIPNEEWLDFVLSNRRVDGRSSNAAGTEFDIISGPVANDAVGLVLNQLLIGTYGDPDSVAARQTAIRLLETTKLYNQIFFATNNAIKCLNFKEAKKIEIN